MKTLTSFLFQLRFYSVLNGVESFKLEKISTYKLKQMVAYLQHLFNQPRNQNDLNRYENICGQMMHALVENTDRSMPDEQSAELEDLILQFQILKTGFGLQSRILDYARAEVSCSLFIKSILVCCRFATLN